jgi:hypothetical protein
MNSPRWSNFASTEATLLSSEATLSARISTWAPAVESVGLRGRNFRPSTTIEATAASVMSRFSIAPAGGVGIWRIKSGIIIGFGFQGGLVNYAVLQVRMKPFERPLDVFRGEPSAMAARLPASDQSRAKASEFRDGMRGFHGRAAE